MSRENDRVAVWAKELRDAARAQEASRDPFGSHDGMDIDPHTAVVETCGYGFRNEVAEPSHGTWQRRCLCRCSKRKACFREDRALPGTADECFGEETHQGIQRHKLVQQHRWWIEKKMICVQQMCWYNKTIAAPADILTIS